MLGNVAVGLNLAAVWFLGQRSPWAPVVIYGPLALAVPFMIRDNMSKVFIASSCIALGHGLMHLFFPFLDSVTGVNHEVDVWQDQILHAFQGVLYGFIFYQNASPAFRVFAKLFVAGLVLNVLVAIPCWNSWCYDAYVWLSLIPATASGLHFAIGTIPYVSERVGWYATLMQGASSICTYFIFRSSDDILKFFAACRFFEVYFIAPHLVGAIYMRLVVNDFKPLRQPSLLPAALLGRIEGGLKLVNPCSLWTGPKQPFALGSTKKVFTATKKSSKTVKNQNSLSAHMKDFMHGGGMIMLGNLSVGINLAAVWHLGQRSPWAPVVIYGPLALAVMFMIRDKVSKVMIVSSCIALGHGTAHLFFPFLDSVTGVNHEVDVWQDQILHAFQGVLFGYIFWQSSGNAFKVFAKLFVAGLVLNVLVAIPCWNSWCYDAYVWLSLIPATASGLHFAIGTIAYVPERVGWYACVMQGASSICTYFIFRSSDDILKFFAACRFFEVYFIAPHLVGAIYGRLAATDFAPIKQPSLLPQALFGSIDASTKLGSRASLWLAPKSVWC